MIDGNRTTYVVELVYTDPDTGEVSPQAVTVAETEHREVAMTIADTGRVLGDARRIKRAQGASFETQKAMSLRVVEKVRTIRTTRDVIA